MKEKIIWFIIGLLCGAIISTGSIFFYTLAANSNTNNSQQNMQQGPGGNQPGNMNGGTPPEMPSNNAQQN